MSDPSAGQCAARRNWIGVLLILVWLIVACDRVPPSRQPTATAQPLPTSTPTPISSLPAEIIAARDAGLDAFRSQAPGQAPPADLAWLGRDTTPVGVKEVTSYEFASSGWTVSVASLSLSANLTQYELVLDHAQTGLRWEGRLNQSLGLVESNLNVSPEALVARQMALEYLRVHDPGHAPPAGVMWMGNRTTAGGLPGRESYQFSADGWAMTVDYELSSSSDLTCEVTLTGPENGFSWRGRVDAQGTVLEHR